MKKTYINPEMEIVKVQMHQQMLAGSLTVDGGDSGTGSVSEDDAPEGDDAGARGFGYGFEFD